MRNNFLSFVIIGVFLMSAPGRVLAVDKKACCENLNDQIKRIQNLVQTLDAEESQYFANVEASLGDLQGFAGTLMSEIRDKKGKWDFNSVKLVADSTAAMTMIGVGAGIKEVSKGVPKIGEVVEGLTNMAEAAGFAAIDAINDGLKLPSNERDLLRKGKDRFKKRAKENDEHERNIAETLNELEEIAKTLRECFDCGIAKSITPQESNPDPRHAHNANFRSIQEKWEKLNYGSIGQPPCDICRNIQGLSNFINGRKYVFQQRKELLLNALQTWQRINSNTLDLLEIVDKELWTGTTGGTISNIVTSGLAAATPWGAAAKTVAEGIFAEIEKSYVRPGIQNLLDVIKEMKKNSQQLEGWGTSDGGEWNRFAKGLQWELNKLNRYLYGKCPEPDICGPERKVSGPKPGKESGDDSLREDIRHGDQTPRHDSVNWNHVNLNYRPPRDGIGPGEFIPPSAGGEDPGFYPQTAPGPGFGNDEGIGELYGIHGPVVSCGEVDKEKRYGVFDASGVLVGFVNEAVLADQPARILELLKTAEARSRQYYSGPGRIFADGFEPGDASSWSTALPNSLPRENVPFVPAANAVLKIGSHAEALNAVAAELHRTLINARIKFRNDECFGVLYVEYRRYVYVIETAYGRVVLKKNEQEAPVIPNDPLFYEKEEEKGKLLGILGSSKKATITIGSGMKMGARVLGGGADTIFVGKGKKSPDVNDQWALREVGYRPLSDPDSAWNAYGGNEKNVTVAVIDTGLYRRHPDGPEYIWGNLGEVPGNGTDDDGNGYVDDVNGWNFVENNADLRDLKGHGTFVAGIIAAKRNNGMGIAGINPGAVIMPLRAADEHGNTNSLHIFRAVKYAVDHGAKIINISLGGKELSRLEQLALNHAYARGALVAAASGNFGDYLGEFGPAGSRRALAVGSVDYDGTTSTISSWGPNNGLIAPGEEIYSLHSEDAPWMGASAERDRLYYKQSGTSFSAPMVTATASLLLAKNRGMTNAQLEDVLMSTAVKKEGVAWEDRAGAGTLNAATALRADPRDYLNLKVVEIRLNRDAKERVESADIFATVRGRFEEFVVELGKGKKAGRFKKIAGPFRGQADQAWVARIDQKELRGSRDWTLRIQAVGKDGDTKTAEAVFSVK